MKKNTHVKTTAELKKFGITMAIAIPLLFNLIFPLIVHRNFHYSLKLWPMVVCSIFLLLSFTSPNSLRVPEILWTKIGDILGYINSRIILGIIFIGIFTPIGVVKKLFFNKKLKASNTHRIICVEQDSKSLERIF